MAANILPANSAEDALGALTALGPLDNLGLTFSVLVPAEAEAAKAYRIDITDEAGSGIATIAESTRKRVEQATGLDYGPAVRIPPSHCMRVAQTAAATLSAIQGEVDKADLDAFDSGAAYAAKATMVAARFSSPSGQSATFYRVADTLLQFRKSKVLTLILRDGRYDRLEPADVLLMRSEFDVVVIAGYAFFFAKSRFEQAFGFLDELKKSSGETFDLVTKSLSIKGVSELRLACTSQPQMMAKMASIRRSMTDDPAYAAAMTMPKLIAFVSSHPATGIEIDTSGGATALVFNPLPATRFKIVNLLDDDYLRSSLTERDYEAGSKTRA